MLKQYSIVTILTAAIAISLFLPWISTPFFGGSPFDLLSAKGVLRKAASENILYLLFPLSFLVAALLAGYTLVKKCCSKIYAIVVGAIPVGLTVYAAIKIALDGDALQGAPFSASDLTQILGLGVYLYVIGSIVLLAFGISGKTEE